MFDSAVAGVVIVILAFIAFIVWAKSATGRTALQNTFGEPHSLKHRQRNARRRNPARPDRRR